MQPVYSTFQVENDPDKQLFEYQAAVGPFQLFLLFAFENDPEQGAEDAFAETVDILEKRLGKRDAGKGYDAFEQALKDVNAVFENPTDPDEHVAGEALQLDAVIGLLDGDVLHVTRAGHAEAYLMRRGTLVEITEGMEPDAEEEGTFASVASGELAASDRVLFATRRLLRYVKKADLVAMFTPRDLSASLEELDAVLREEDGLSVAVSACVMEEDEDEEADAPAEDEDGAVDEPGATQPVARSARTARRRAADRGEHPAVRTLRVAAGVVRRGSAVAWSKSKPVLERVWEWFLAQDKRTKVRVLAAVVVTLALAVGLSAAWLGSERRGQATLMEQKFQAAKAAVAEARNKRLFDPAGSKASLEEARKSLVEVARSGLFVSDVQQLLAEIEQEAEGADRITRVNAPKVIADLSKKDAALSIAAFTFHNQAFYLLYQSGILGPVVDSNPDTYGRAAIDGGDLLLAVANFADRNAMAILTRNGRLVEFKDNAFSFLEIEGGAWKPGTAIRTFSNRQFVYVLDAASNAIWKYERTNKQYRAPTNYNTDRADLSKAVSFAIDGNVYVLRSDGQVMRFYSQKPQPFSIEGGPSTPLQNLDNNAKIYTSENLRNIYILDPANERVLVYRKQTFEKTEKMVYERQFVFQGEKLHDIYVDETEQGLYVASMQRILKADLRIP